MICIISFWKNKVTLDEKQLIKKITDQFFIFSVELWLVFKSVLVEFVWHVYHIQCLHFEKSNSFGEQRSHTNKYTPYWNITILKQDFKCTKNQYVTIQKRRISIFSLNKIGYYIKKWWNKLQNYQPTITLESCVKKLLLFTKR